MFLGGLGFVDNARHVKMDAASSLMKRTRRHAKRKNKETFLWTEMVSLHGLCMIDVLERPIKKGLDDKKTTPDNKTM